MTFSSVNNLNILIRQLIKEVNELTPTLIAKTRQIDEKTKLHKPKWTERHRLQVLLEAAQEAEKSLPKYLRVPWFLAEFVATVEIIRRWSKKPIWKELEPPLEDPNHFTHTIATLLLAEHFQRLGHTVEIIPKGKNASPDLMVRLCDTDTILNIECYQPERLADESIISQKELDKIVDRSMEKAKRQLPNNSSGILAICGFGQPKKKLETLKATIKRRLELTERPNLCGILTIFFSVLYGRSREGQQLTPMISVDFIPNSSYFGRLIISEDEVKGDPRLIKKPLKDIGEGRLLQKVEEATEKKVSLASSEDNQVTRHSREERLGLIDKPPNASRAVMHSKVALPLFKGEGNTNYLCGRCGMIIAKHAWKFSISNIVVECPSCHSFSEFPELEQIALPLFGSVALEKGDYNLNEAIILRRGACLIGLR
jgi:hypothetical protein